MKDKNKGRKHLKLQDDDYTWIDKKDWQDLKKGDVILVRSNYKHDVYGDHFAIIVGGVIHKDRGTRPNLVTLPPLKKKGRLSSILDKFTPSDGAIILKLTPEAAERVSSYYKVHLSEGEVSPVEEKEAVTA